MIKAILIDDEANGLNQVQHKETRFNKIAIPTIEGFELVPADQVLRCEADDNYTYLFPP